MKLTSIFLMLGFVCSCQSCFKEYPETGSLISQDYDFVVGVLAPDSSIQFERQYATEVFVGKIVPAGNGNIFTIEGVSDPVLYNLLYDTRLHYRVYYEYDPTAVVFIKNGNDSTQLTYIDHGIYRDLGHGLKIRSAETYDIIVHKSDGEIYYSTTTVPKEIYVTNPAQDTLKLIPDSYSGSLVKINVSYDEEPVYIIEYAKKSNFPPLYFYFLKASDLNLGFIFQASGIDTTRIDTVHAEMELRSVDTNFAVFNQPSSFGAPDDFWREYYHKFEYMPIRKRSNIQGGSDVVGVFGSYSAAVKKYTAIALWDSVGH